jgi:hypothetical protein
VPTASKTAFYFVAIRTRIGSTYREKFPVGEQLPKQLAELLAELDKNEATDLNGTGP